MEVKRTVLKAGNWTTYVSGHSLKLSKAAKEEALELIKDYTHIFPKEDVFVWNKFNVPSLILSMNCTFKSALNVYSISQNPKNLGIAVKVNAELQVLLKKARSNWPVMKTIFNPRFQDDYLWTDIIQMQDAGKLSASKKDIILLRDTHFDEKYEYIKKRSITCISKRNLNSYGEKMDLWTKVNPGEVDNLPWKKGFALKPLSKIESTFNIYNCWQYKGLINESKVKTLLNNRSFYIQNFIRPMPSLIDEEKMIYKIYFAFDSIQKEYIYLGGMWLSRDNYQVYGTPETTFGKLI